jgi:hypothetical protein
MAVAFQLEASLQGIGIELRGFGRVERRLRGDWQATPRRLFRFGVGFSCKKMQHYMAPRQIVT